MWPPPMLNNAALHFLDLFNAGWSVCCVFHRPSPFARRLQNREVHRALTMVSSVASNVSLTHLRFSFL